MKLSVLLTAAALLSLPGAAFAADEYNVNNGLTLTGHPLGMHGVDPVTMFRADAPSVGDAAHTATYDGVDYYFSTAETKALFESEPEAFLPQFGGFCAFGVFVGKKLDGDVRYADIVDGKLYLFVNAAIFEKYLEDKAAVIAGAAEKWPGIASTAATDL
ncbi:YHS domain-containing (seleno)protein [Jannaschia seohaensis]|uniref:YHS domain-containing protein n=1 Tax=Jannaschia seohaensis TaxID=475081 RepID=A0A2Y9AIS3_9RHOB|nr:YHS domain-containing (seleno)protein [Jannaschia seohaensis]PWJ20331.1 YHS domain-containing protein [Jannaschia seohaensis]SSA44374.1 YHS domain-containing protein [Jannaschia seohaensis]